MLFIFDLIRPYEGPMLKDATQIAERAFKSLKLVEKLAPDFGTVSYKNGPEIRTLEEMPSTWPDMVKKDSFISGFDTQSEVNYRSISYSSGTLDRTPTKLRINASSEFTSDPVALRSLLEALIVDWDASEAIIGRYETERLPWLRWLKNDQLLESVVAKPMDEGWSKRDPIASGVMYEWPENTPALETT